MIIQKIIIIDNSNKEANSFDFSSTANIITAKKNTQGKSCLIKSIYYALGLDVKTFKPDWQQTKKIFKIYYEHNDKQGTIIRYGNRIWINEEPNSLNLKEYSLWLSNLLNLKIKLSSKDNETYDEVYSSAYILPFYLDQDNSWSGILYKGVVNELGAYNSTQIPKALFEYIFNISNEKVIKLEEERFALNSEKNNLEIQKKSIKELKEDFIKEVEPIIFDENEIKEYIQKYLNYAQIIQEKIQIKKNNIYTAEVKLDELKLEHYEIEEIIEHLDSEHKNIKTKCKYCNSELLVEQSIQRYKLMNNKYDFVLEREKLKQKIEKQKEIVNKLLNEKLNLEEEYCEILKISEIKQKEYSFNEYIENQARSLTKDNYYEVENKLSLEISKKEDNITEIQKAIRESKKAQKSLTETISNNFYELMTKLNAKFPEVNLTAHKFLEFNGIKNSGATYNAEFFILYITYLKLLLDYAIIKIPLGLDSVIKDEVDPDNINNFYKTIEKYILKSESQSFVVMLDDKIKLLEQPQNYNFIELEKPILDKNKYESLCKEVEVILS